MSERKKLSLDEYGGIIMALCLLFGCIWYVNQEQSNYNVNLERHINFLEAKINSLGAGDFPISIVSSDIMGRVESGIGTKYDFVCYYNTNNSNTRYCCVADLGCGTLVKDDVKR